MENKITVFKKKYCYINSLQYNIKYNTSLYKDKSHDIDCNKINTSRITVHSINTS